MKIVINRCWGGFGLSNDAVLRYAELKGFKVYPVVDKRDKDGRFVHKFANYTNQKDPFSIHYLTKPLREDGTYEEGSYFSPIYIDRTDPVLVQVVEEMGDVANDENSSLHIVEIPDDVKYEIDNYDGMETVHEIHRSWG